MKKTNKYTLTCESLGVDFFSSKRQIYNGLLTDKRLYSTITI